VGTTPRPTKHGFSGIPLRFLSRLWERRASLEKTLSLTQQLWNCDISVTSERPLQANLQVLALSTLSSRTQKCMRIGCITTKAHVTVYSCSRKIQRRVAQVHGVATPCALTYTLRTRQPRGTLGGL